MARQFASLDHLSGGRAAWNVVTSWDAFTGENFRRGGFLPQEDRYERARTFLETTWELFDSWRGDEIIADKASGRLPRRCARRASSPTPTRTSTSSGRFNVPRSPQGRPVIFQAGDSDEGREFAAASADAIFSRHGTLADGPGLLRRRQGPPGPARPPPGPAADPAGRDVRARRHRRRGAGAGPGGAAPAGQRADRDRASWSSCGTGTCPATTRTARCRTSIPTRARTPSPAAGPACGCTGIRWPPRPSGGPRRRQSKLSIRELIIEVTGRQTFVGAPATVAGRDQSPRPVRRQRRVHPRPAHHPGRASTSSPTRSCRCCRNAASSGPTTKAARCASTWASRRCQAGQAVREVAS